MFQRSSEQPGPSPKRSASEESQRIDAPVSTRRSIISRTALALILSAGMTACAADEFTMANPGDDDAATDAAPDSPDETSTDSGDSGTSKDSGFDANDASTDAPDPACGSSGAVVFDQSKMPCFKVLLDRTGSIVPAPQSSDNTPACEPGGCANTPLNGDLDVLWAAETGNTGYFSSVKTPVAYNAHCLPGYSSLNPPDLNQLMTALTLSSGWMAPTVKKTGSDYQVDAAPCAGQSVVYVMQYGP